MQEQSQEGAVTRDGVPLAERIVITRRFEPKMVPVPMAGQASTRYKDLSTEGPTTIRVEGPEPGFREELERLKAAATDVEVGRRDRGWRPQPVSIEIDGESFEDCGLDRPLNGYGALEAVEFTLYHERL
jgi:hypothetical protein